MDVSSKENLAISLKNRKLEKYAEIVYNALQDAKLRKDLVEQRNNFESEIAILLEDALFFLEEIKRIWAGKYINGKRDFIHPAFKGHFCFGYEGVYSYYIKRYSEEIKYRKIKSVFNGECFPLGNVEYMNGGSRPLELQAADKEDLDLLYKFPDLDIITNGKDDEDVLWFSSNGSSLNIDAHIGYITNVMNISKNKSKVYSKNWVIKRFFFELLEENISFETIKTNNVLLDLYECLNEINLIDPCIVNGHEKNHDMYNKSSYLRRILDSLQSQLEKGTFIKDYFADVTFALS